MIEQSAKGDVEARFEDGRLVLAGARTAGSATSPLINPWDGQTLGTIHTASASQVDEAVDAAAEGSRQLQAMPLYERIAVLDRVADRIAEQSQELALVSSLQTGKALTSTLREVERAQGTIRTLASAAMEARGEVVPGSVEPGGEGLTAFVVREPVGVVAAITPFNAPFNIPMHKVVGALVCGNGVVLKPAEQAPQSCLAIGDLLLEAGLPPDALSVLPGDVEVGRALVSHPGVAAITFTGSRAVGEAISRDAGLRRLVLELGGNSPNVVHRDVDPSRVAPILARGAFSNTGQSCNSVQRVIAHADIVDELVVCLVDAAEQLVVGDPTDPDTDVGTLVDRPSAERVERWIHEAVDAGATLHTGGDRRGATVMPAVLSDVAGGQQLVCEEAFGPVAVIMSYRDVDEAIAIANDTPYGLQSGVFTGSLKVAHRVATGIKSGGVMINRSSNTRLDHLPFGGRGASGVAREGARYTVDALTETKLVLLDTVADLTRRA